jgi:hypothetical protein
LQGNRFFLAGVLFFAGSSIRLPTLDGCAGQKTSMQSVKQQHKTIALANFAKALVEKWLMF